MVQMLLDRMAQIVTVKRVISQEGCDAQQKCIYGFTAPSFTMLAYGKNVT